MLRPWLEARLGRVFTLRQAPGRARDLVHLGCEKLGLCRVDGRVGRWWRAPSRLPPAVTADPDWYRLCALRQGFVVADVVIGGLPVADCDRRPPEPWQVEVCRRAMETWPRSRYVMASANSYDIKHEIEAADGGYVANGAVIAAALHLGLKVRRAGRGQNANFDLKRRSR
jgi:hypothetical protein